MFNTLHSESELPLEFTNVHVHGIDLSNRVQYKWF